MNIFVSGATGYIGNNLAKRLASEGHTIHALCRPSGKEQLLEHPNIKLFEGDINDYQTIHDAMVGCQQAYHLAAFARVWAKDSSTFYRINVEGTKNVLDAAREAGIEKIVFTSTAGVLGPSNSRPVSEDHARIGEVMNEYEDSKTQAELLCKDYCTKYGMHIVIVNPPRVYGPGVESESNAVTRLLKLFMKGKWRIMPGDGKRTGSYVHVDDVVTGHVLAMEKGRSAERYILSGVNASYLEFFGLIMKLTGKQTKLYHFPVWLMVFCSYSLMAWTKISGKAPLLTPKWVKKYFYDWSLSCEKAQNELGYSYRSLEEGLAQTIKWLERSAK